MHISERQRVHIVVHTYGYVRRRPGVADTPAQWGGPPARVGSASSSGISGDRGGPHPPRQTPLVAAATEAAAVEVVVATAIIVGRVAAGRGGCCSCRRRGCGTEAVAAGVVAHRSRSWSRPRPRADAVDAGRGRAPSRPGSRRSPRSSGPPPCSGVLAPSPALSNPCTSMLVSRLGPMKVPEKDSITCI